MAAVDVMATVEDVMATVDAAPASEQPAPDTTVVEQEAGGDQNGGGEPGVSEEVKGVDAGEAEKENTPAEATEQEVKKNLMAQIARLEGKSNESKDEEKVLGTRHLLFRCHPFDWSALSPRAGEVRSTPCWPVITFDLMCSTHAQEGNQGRQGAARSRGRNQRQNQVPAAKVP